MLPLSVCLHSFQLDTGPVNLGEINPWNIFKAKNTDIKGFCEPTILRRQIQKCPSSLSVLYHMMMSNAGSIRCEVVSSLKLRQK